MIRILHTADWHIGDFVGPVEDGGNVRAEDTRRCIRAIVDEAEKEKPDIAMISGDIFHQARVWGNRALDEVGYAIEFIEELAQFSGQVICMRGTPNHDGYEQFEMLSQYFENVPNVEIVTTPRVVNALNMDIACIPGFSRDEYRAKFPGLSKEEENAVFSQELANICIGLKASCRGNVPTALMAHYTVPGCNSESGQATFLQNFEPVLGSEILAAAEYDIICLGHIHRPQQLPNVKNCFYSGAANAMNFNDEGQTRGFWMHDFTDADHIDSRLVELPYREFQTIRLNDDEVGQINAGGIEMLATMKWRGQIDQKIVRVLYECSLDNNKALNKAVLEKQLLSDNAFYVWEISPVAVTAVADRQDMGTKTDPEENLRKYLAEKQYTTEQINHLVTKARPIIAEAIASSTSASLTGVFEPVSIEVKNYRNYAEETFDFTDISFCTINGQNGAGKSSLFMDAIVDALYEQPREGDLTGWIRNDEKARSGSITFTFKIGDKTFRVNRTRLRSGKGTLSLAELVDGEWEGRSKEKYKDTQEEIVQLLGMDSMTFKSCALIMQDQYGLFLQAPKEDRMVILGNLLGLGIYGTMEEIAWKTGKQFGAKMRDTKAEIGVHEATISAYGTPEGDLAEKQEALANQMKSGKALQEKKDVLNAELLVLLDAKEQAEKIKTSISSLEAKKTGYEANKRMQTDVIDGCKPLLEMENTILEKAEKYRSLDVKRQELIGASSLYTAKKSEADRLNAESASVTAQLTAKKQNLFLQQTRMAAYQDTSGDEEILMKAKEYETKKAEHDKMVALAAEYNQAIGSLNLAKSNLAQARKDIENAERSFSKEIEYLQSKTTLLESSGCIDIEHAECRFLYDAIEAKKRMQDVIAGHDEKMAILKEKEVEASKDVTEKIWSVPEYNQEEANKLKLEVASLFPYVAKAKAIEEKANEIAILKASMESVQSNIAELEQRLVQVNLEAQRAMSEAEEYASAFAETKNIESEMSALRTWIETEKQLPVMKERYSNACERVTEIMLQISDLQAEIDEKTAEYGVALAKSNGMEVKQAEVNAIAYQISVSDGVINDLQMAIGAINQKLEDIKRIRDEIKKLQEQSRAFASETADYDTLKAAFSQDGIPHQIIRSIVPQLTDTANNILGQMTGGKMGIEFRTEKVLKSNSKKEVTTLDILIEEYGKSTLPYLSKSGGEKVKASLSVILSLAEIKSSSAGIQLGMLFIDEPPFLDSDGIQAYCDALETIQNRYPSIKIMAITHDPTMKARFPQSLDVIKTDEGSKVIY